MSSINRRAWSRLVAISKPFLTSELRWRARAGLAIIIGLLLGLNGLNVINSYVGRGFMTAIADREIHRYYLFAMLYIAVFAASSFVAVIAQFAQDRLALLWRQWLTRRLVDRYLAGVAFFRINERDEVDNPDQRISEDVRSFTTTLLAFVVLIVNSTMTTIAFAGILWSITPWLLVAAVAYAVFGSLMTILVGRKLVGLDNLQLKKEADLRFELVHVRENTEPIVLLNGAAKEKRTIGERLGHVVSNAKAIIAVNRNIGFFTSGFNYLVPILPVFVVAPMYLDGEIEFGEVTQAAMAFAQLLGALSVFVAQFQNISIFAAVVGRLGSMTEAIEEAGAAHLQPIHITGDADRLAYEHLTLRTPQGDQALITDLSLDIPPGRRLLILGNDGAGKSALFRATAGVWEHGEGRIFCPPRDQVLFLPQRPYMVFGTVRDQLLYGLPDASFSEERLLAVLRQVKFEPILQRIGGLDVERDWPNTLSTGEQQLLAFARLLLASPRFAFLDQAVSALGPQRGKQLYQILAATPITFVSIGDHVHLESYHDTVLELQQDGSWTVKPAQSALSA